MTLRAVLPRLSLALAILAGALWLALYRLTRIPLIAYVIASR
jgi:hypothetical protein